MSKEINKCPVCGEKMFTILHNEGHHWVVCDSLPGMHPSCGLSGPAEDTEDAAIAAWNRLSYRKPTEVVIHAYRHIATGGVVYAIEELDKIDPKGWKFLDCRSVEFDVE